MPSGDETAFHADAADSARETRGELARFGIADRAPCKGCHGHPLSEADKKRNAGIAVVRSGVERVFAVCKRCYGLGRTRFPGLAKNTTFYGLAAIALNIRKGTIQGNHIWDLSLGWRFVRFKGILPSWPSYPI